MKKLSGLTLLEVMVSLLLLTFTFIAVSSLQIAAMNISYNSYFKTIAALQIESLLTQLHAHPKNNITLIKKWQEENKLVLPNGQGNIEKSDTSIKITVKWNNQICKRNVGWSECLERKIKI